MPNTNENADPRSISNVITLGRKRSMNRRNRVKPTQTPQPDSNVTIPGFGTRFNASGWT